jgi:hypothetical protein
MKLVEIIADSLEIADVQVTGAGVAVDREEWPPLGTTSWVGVLIAGLMGGIWDQIDGSGHWQFSLSDF